MGNIFRNTTTEIVDDDPPDPTRIRPPASMGSEPIIRIPFDPNMNSSPEKRLTFRVRQCATDFPATIEAHKDHTVATLKQCLIEHVSMPFPSEDGRCKIIQVRNKQNLQSDQPLQTDGGDKHPMNKRYLGGSIDHLRLGEYGLENGDFLMFTVMFPQLANASNNSL